MPTHPSSSRLSVLLPWLAAALATGVVWLPAFLSFYVPTPTVTSDEASRARTEPPDSVLDELGRLTPGYMLKPQWTDDAALITTADDILAGVVALPGIPRFRIELPFDPTSLDGGTQNRNLLVAGLGIPATLLAAYDRTNDDRYLLRARDMALVIAEHERRAWWPRPFLSMLREVAVGGGEVDGILWNDHAVANRIPVLAELWQRLRGRPDLDEDTAATILTFAARSARLLSQSDYFTFATNHGVMQNLALWHYALAFPTLPGAEAYATLAFERFNDQIGFYLASDGCILEHSPQYQRAGTVLLTMADHYFALLGYERPAGWQARYPAAREVYAALRRPDGSVPVFGDTVNGLNNASDDAVLAMRHETEPRATVFPIGGLAAWTAVPPGGAASAASHTAVTWANFSGHGHKHADELAVSVWAAGQSWWTNVGYWPYATPGRAQAEGWDGSNAPHLVGEGMSSDRRASLLGYGFADALTVVDLERIGPGTSRFRRQVVHVHPRLWIVLDHSHDPSGGMARIVWNGAHDLTMQPRDDLGARVYALRSSRATMTTHIIGSSEATVALRKETWDPFAGWNAIPVSNVSTQAVPAPAMVVDWPANDEWIGSVWELEDAEQARPDLVEDPRMDLWDGAARWSLSLRRGDRPLQIERHGDRLAVRGASIEGSPLEVSLSHPPDGSEDMQMIAEAYERAARKYPRVNRGMYYRARLTWTLGVAWVLQMLGLFAYRLLGGKHPSAAYILSTIAWLAGAGALIVRYLS